MSLGTEKTGGLPPRILIYGTPKIGKSSFGEKSDRPIFNQIEDGLDALNVDAFPLVGQLDDISGFDETMNNMVKLLETDHDHKTLVTDSLDHLEPYIWQQVCTETNAQRIELADGGYGKGYVAALNLWREFYKLQNRLRKEKGMTIINICHAKVQRFESPTTDAYDRYELKLHKSAAALAFELSDIILFANYYVGIKKEADSAKQKDEDKRKRGVGSGERILYTEERPAFIAGNRYGLPAEIPFTKDGAYWNVLAEHVPFFQAPAPEEKLSAVEENGVKKTKKKA